MSCSILQIEFEPSHSSSAPSPLQPACHTRTGSEGDHNLHQIRPRRLLAVRHTFGVSVFLLEANEQAETPRACLKPVCYVPAVMDVVALHWSLFLPGQLLYTCVNLETFLLQIGDVFRSPESAPGGTPTEKHARCSKADRVPSQPRLVVVSFSEPLSSRPKEHTDAAAAALPARHPEEVWPCGFCA